MFPIGDDNSDRTITPFVNYAFIAINILVFVLLQGIGGNDAFSYAFSLVPREVTSGIDLTGVQIIQDAMGNTGEVRHYPTPLPVYFNFLSSMFMHGDIMHISAYAVSVDIGDNLKICSGNSVCCFLTFGPAARSPRSSWTPIRSSQLGASGAISGVLGGYVFCFRSGR